MSEQHKHRAPKERYENRNSVVLTERGEKVASAAALTAAGALILGAVGLGIKGLEANDNKVDKHLNSQEVTELKHANHALNRVIVLKEGVAWRSAPIDTRDTGEDMTFAGRVQEGQVLRADRPIDREIDGKTWIGFTKFEKGDHTNGSDPENMYWVNIGDLKPEINYEEFNFPAGRKSSPTDINVYSDKAGNFTTSAGVLRTPNTNVAIGSSVSAEVFYDQMIGNEGLTPFNDVEIGTALKISK